MKKRLSLLFISLALLPGLAWSAESYLATPSTGTARFLLLDRANPARRAENRNSTPPESSNVTPQARLASGFPRITHDIANPARAIIQ